VHRFRVPHGIAHQRPLLGLGDPTGDALADLDRQGFSGDPVVLRTLGVAEVHRPQRLAVLFEQVDPALVVGQQGGRGATDGVADLRNAYDRGETRAQVRDGIAGLRPRV